MICNRILIVHDVALSLHAVICQNPVYVYPHSKNILMQAIIADTEFLEENSIMDYSLLTCIDSSTGELVVGIIGEPCQ